MKKIIVCLLFCYLVNPNADAQSINDTITWQNSDRAFITYVPSSYSITDTVPLVFALHGLGDIASNFESFMGMNAVADTANFIVVYPQALVDPLTNNQTAFSSGINFFSGVDDVGFVNALIDTLVNQYNIDTTRVYATGFSMGGFMTHRLACQLSDRLTAVASVSGQMAMSIPPNCNPVKEIPLMHIHGTADGTVRYNGYDSLQMLSVDSTLAIWQMNNGCTGEPTLVYSLPNNAPDNFITTAYRWIDCNNNSEILLYKVDSADHQWFYEPASDFDAATEIWKFFMRHPNNGLTNEISDASIKKNEFIVYPNPFSDHFTINLPPFGNTKIKIADMSGKVLHKIDASSGSVQFDGSSLTGGVYFLMQYRDNKLVDVHKIARF
jgi:polyhydroxybutyrate depolymerase